MTDFSGSPLLAAGVFTASILGSTHCAAMCGGFACLYGAGDSSLKTSSLLTAHSSYHGGRLVAYTTLGAIAGILGASFNAAGELAGIQKIAAIITGVFLLLWGIALLARAFNIQTPSFTSRFKTGDRTARIIGSLLLPFKAQSPTVRAGALGLLTGLLPCGWLYAFVITSAGTGSALSGALFMTIFWAGTVPSLAAIASGMRFMSTSVRKRMPVIGALIIIGTGIYSLSGRLSGTHASHSHASTESSEATLHHEH